MFERYQPSGRFGFSGVAALVAAGVLAAGLAWPYQRLVDWMPLIYVEFLLSLGFGIALGAMAAACLAFGRSRSPAMNAVGIVLIAVAGWAGSFWWDRGFLHAKIYEEAKKIFADDQAGVLPPEEESLAEFTFGDYVDAKKEIGWSIGHVGRSGTGGGGLPIKGFAVYLVWLAELGLIGFYAWKHAMPKLDRAFCEPCGQFATPRELRPALGVRLAPMREAADRGDLAALASPAVEKGVALVGQYTLHECPTCRDGGWLDVDTVLAVPSEKGKPKLHRTPVARHITLSRSQRDQVVAARERVPEPAADATEAGPKAPPKGPARGLPSDG